MRNFILSFAIVLLSLPVTADIGEGELSNYKSVFLKKIIANNPEREQEIRRCMEGFIRDGRSGMRLIDKFGLFLYDSRKSNLTLDKIRYFHDGAAYIFMITLKDNADGALYNLFLDYRYETGRGAYRLADISFSMVFAERMKSVTEFFGGG